MGGSWLSSGKCSVRRRRMITAEKRSRYELLPHTGLGRHGRDPRLGAMILVVCARLARIGDCGSVDGLLESGSEAKRRIS